ncbi:SURF1 family protein [Spongiibacter sp. KMU-158]|uniref:SURF1-like protein n=1 Tax=Spongiibacter pelagi TaxID=2760804 RepID=A0A927C3S7_9GAMM|nr:SURF1 family protein [Spongiibacter pelagi]
MLAVLGLAAFISFIALGNWQVERRAWKLDLIERVNARVHAQAVSAPLPSEWVSITRDSHEYLHVFLTGHFVQGKDTLVVAATDLGSGYWVMTPFKTERRGTVYINRGYIGQGVSPAAPPTGELRLEGLLRMNEPVGSVLRENQPEQDRWFSRDVLTMADQHGLSVAPYFVDAAKAQPGSPGGNGPVGGLTVIQFHNSHLVYILTWYGLALMVLVAAFLVWREERRRAISPQD